MLARSEVHTNIPARDLAQARAPYTHVLALTPSTEGNLMRLDEQPSS